MCAVSAITDYYREKWPVMPTIPETPIHPWLLPYYHFTPLRTVTEVEWAEYQELKRRMEAYDAATGQPDCVKPEVAIWEQAIESELANQRRSTNK